MGVFANLAALAAWTAPNMISAALPSGLISPQTVSQNVEIKPLVIDLRALFCAVPRLKPSCVPEAEVVMPQ
jgi:hypothetical protein